MPANGDGFITRWIRRKSEAEAALPAEAAAPAAGEATALRPAVDALAAVDADAAAPGASDVTQDAAEPAEPAPELPPPALPSLDDVSGGKDIAAFFARHVPEELRLAALRKAWVSDPAISGFIEMAENQWDFNSPGGALAAGFGAMPAGFDVAKLADQIMGIKPEPAIAEAAGADTPPPQVKIASQETAPSETSVSAQQQITGEAVAITPAAESHSAVIPPAVMVPPLPPAPPLRRHGGALPRG